MYYNKYCIVLMAILHYTYSSSVLRLYFLVLLVVPLAGYGETRGESH